MSLDRKKKKIVQLEEDSGVNEEIRNRLGKLTLVLEVRFSETTSLISLINSNHHIKIKVIILMRNTSKEAHYQISLERNQMKVTKMK